MLFLAGSALTWLLFSQVNSSAGWLGLTLSVFVFGAVVAGHRRLDRSTRRFEQARLLAADRQARTELNWGVIPSRPVEFDEQHPFASDLEVVGDRSLHQLLDQSVTQAGSDQLAKWLLSDVESAAKSNQRQTQVRELAGRAGFRHRLRLSSSLVADHLDVQRDQRLLAWLTGGQSGGSLRSILILLIVLGGLNALLLGASLILGLPAFWIVGLAVYALISLSRMQSAAAAFGDSHDVGLALEQFGAVFHFLETYPLPATLLEVGAPFRDISLRPSAYLGRIRRIVAATSLQRNPVLWLLLNAVLPWDLFFAYQLERIKAELQHYLPQWLDAWAQIEALVSLASLTDNPGSSFPELAELEAPGPHFLGRALAHPLLPHDQRVGNNYQAIVPNAIALITGSNMSGKSTYLRTVGINAVLALAGGPIIGDSMRMKPVRLFTSLQIQDSLADGLSFFYAEVRRLKSLLAASERTDLPPLLYLIDEIFRGTNNRERLIGSRAYIRRLAQQSGFGLIATHDLDLVQLTEATPHLENFHFRESIQAGTMVFDYQLRPGPCPTTNALKIMELAGLPIE